MLKFDEILFVVREDGAIVLSGEGHHVGVIRKDNDLDEYYFKPYERWGLVLYSSEMSVISAKLIELNGEKV